MKSLLLVLLSSFIFTACGGGYNPDKAAAQNAEQAGSLKYIPLADGKGLMPESLKDIKGAANFEVSFSLQEGGSAVFFFFADANLTKGISVEFKKEQGQLKVFSHAQGQTQEWTPLFAAVDATDVMTFSLDIHNNETPAHIMIWSGAKNASMDHRNTIYNSAEDSLDLNYDAAPGNGMGRSWGFQVINGELRNLKTSAPQDAH